MAASRDFAWLGPLLVIFALGCRPAGSDSSPPDSPHQSEASPHVGPAKNQPASDRPSEDRPLEDRHDDGGPASGAASVDTGRNPSGFQGDSTGENEFPASGDQNSIGSDPAKQASTTSDEPENAADKTGKNQVNGQGDVEPPVPGKPQRPEPDPHESAVIEMLERVGGRFERALTAGGDARPIAIVQMPGSKATDKDLECLKKLPAFYSLSLESPAFSDGSVAHLLEMRKLNSIQLQGNQFTDASLKTLANHPTLRIITLRGAAIGLAGVLAIAKSESVQYLDLIDIPVTPDILTGLKELRRLREIKLVGTGINDKDLEQLKELLPDCEVKIQ